MSSAFSRLALFLVALVVIVCFYIPLGHADFAGRWGEGTFGLSLPQWASRAVAVAPGSPAEAAGVRTGDRLVVRPHRTTWLEAAFPHAGDETDLTFSRAGNLYHVHLRAVPVNGFTRWDRWMDVLAIVPATVFFLIAAVLVYLRPNVMTWAFLAYAAGYYSTAPAFAYYHALIDERLFLVLSFVLTTVFGNLAVLPLVPFVLRFPDDRLSGWTKRADIVAWCVIGIAFLGYAQEWLVVWLGGGRLAFSPVLDHWLPLSSFAAAAVILIAKYKRAAPNVRQRVGFLVVGLIVSFVAYAVYFVPGVPTATAQIVGYAVVLMPVSVAYAVLRHRVLDINFVLNRALAYGVLSVLVIAFISLLDWMLSRIVSEQRLATGIELLVTIGIGFLLDRINRATSSFVDATFFRRRYAAEGYMRRAADALPYATEESAISDGLTQVPADALELSAAALYRKSLDGTRFEGVATSSDTTMAPPGFDRNHLLVRMLAASEARIWLDEVRSHLDAEQAAMYALAVPVTVRHDLVAFALYGVHRNGAQLDPEEVTLLEALAREAARAYDHVEAVRIRAYYATAAPQGWTTTGTTALS